MSDEVQFDTDMQGSRSYSRPAPGGMPSQAYVPPSSGLAGWLMRHGFAKTPAGAQKVMVAIIVIDIIAMFVVIKYLL